MPNNIAPSISDQKPTVISIITQCETRLKAIMPHAVAKRNAEKAVEPKEIFSILSQGPKAMASADAKQKIEQYSLSLMQDMQKLLSHGKDVATNSFADFSTFKSCLKTFAENYFIKQETHENDTPPIVLMYVLDEKTVELGKIIIEALNSVILLLQNSEDLAGIVAQLPIVSSSAIKLLCTAVNFDLSQKNVIAPTIKVITHLQQIIQNKIDFYTEYLAPGKIERYQHILQIQTYGRTDFLEKIKPMTLMQDAYDSISSNIINKSHLENDCNSCLSLIISVISAYEKLNGNEQQLVSKPIPFKPLLLNLSDEYIQGFDGNLPAYSDMEEERADLVLTPLKELKQYQKQYEALLKLLEWQPTPDALSIENVPSEKEALLHHKRLLKEDLDYLKAFDSAIAVLKDFPITDKFNEYKAQRLAVSSKINDEIEKICTGSFDSLKRDIADGEKKIQALKEQIETGKKEALERIDSEYDNDIKILAIQHGNIQETINTLEHMIDLFKQKQDDSCEEKIIQHELEIEDHKTKITSLKELMHTYTADVEKKKQSIASHQAEPIKSLCEELTLAEQTYEEDKVLLALLERDLKADDLLSKWEAGKSLMTVEQFEKYQNLEEKSAYLNELEAFIKGLELQPHDLLQKEYSDKLSQAKPAANPSPTLKERKKALEKKLSDIQKQMHSVLRQCFLLNGEVSQQGISKSIQLKRRHLLEAEFQDLLNNIQEKKLPLNQGWKQFKILLKHHWQAINDPSAENEIQTRPKSLELFINKIKSALTTQENKELQETRNAFFQLKQTAQEKYIKDTFKGQLTSYLVDRSKTYWLKDLFSNITACMFGCLGYQSDAFIRQKYVEDLQKLCDDSETDTIRAKINEGITEFKKGRLVDLLTKFNKELSKPVEKSEPAFDI